LQPATDDTTHQTSSNNKPNALQGERTFGAGLRQAVGIESCSISHGSSRLPVGRGELTARGKRRAAVGHGEEHKKIKKEKIAEDEE
jgi:hypothetical protein